MICYDKATKEVDVNNMKKDIRERFTLRVPGILLQLLEAHAEIIGVSINALILQILWDWAQKNSPDRQDENPGT